MAIEAVVLQEAGQSHKATYDSLSAVYTDLRKAIDSVKNMSPAQARALEKSAMATFSNVAAETLGLHGRDIFAAAGKERLRAATNIGPRLTGRMIFFFYNPKYRNNPKKLPYYDMAPLVIPIEFYTGKSAGFLGLNLHYLPIPMRAAFLEGLFRIYMNRHLDESKKLSLSYQYLKTQATGALRYFRPCLHRYLYKDPKDALTGIRSRIMVVDPTEWQKLIYLPVQNFRSASGAAYDSAAVWSKARQMVSKDMAYNAYNKRKGRR